MRTRTKMSRSFSRMTVLRMVEGEAARVSEDAHDVADAQRKDVVGGERGHQDARTDEEVSPDGEDPARHHLTPADTTQGIAGECKTENAEDPRRMFEAEGEDLIEGDSAEGVPEEEGADEKTGNGLRQVAAGAGCGGGAHAGTWASEGR
jgi:hypothetical protein